MKTECPHCHTLFRLTEDQLDMAGGQVRCGYCNAVFTALRNDDFIDDDRQLDVFEDMPEAKHDDIQYNITQEADEQDRAYAPAQGETEPVAALRENESTALFKEESNEVVPSHFRTDAPDGFSTWPTLLWSVAILLLIASLVAEYTWFNREQLLNQRQLQPYIAALCEQVHCDEHISLRDPENIEMLNRNVYTHPNEKNALMITATIINHAGFAQALPDVQIEFSGTRGDVVASRRFKPAEYLQSGHDQLSQMQPDVPVTIGLEIIDPGKDAITYEFTFL